MLLRLLLVMLIIAAGLAAFFGLPISKESAESMREDEVLSEKIMADPQQKFPAREPPSQIVPPASESGEKAVDKQLKAIQEAVKNLEISIKSITPDSKSSPPQKQKFRLPQAELHRIASQSVVNLLCQEEGGAIAIATGALIHPAGYILTNAHIADNADKEQECAIRTGSPAKSFAIAKRVFTPSAFSATTSITEQIKWDIAIWKIEKPSGTTPLPETFEALTLDLSHNFFPQEALATFSYPAELLSKEVILSSLYLVFSETAVEGIDEFFIQSLAGLGSQQGSSGGALLDPVTGAFVGLIFAIDKETEINKRRLFALRASRIDEIVRQETGKTFADYLKSLEAN